MPTETRTTTKTRTTSTSTTITTTRGPTVPWKSFVQQWLGLPGAILAALTLAYYALVLLGVL